MAVFPQWIHCKTKGSFITVIFGYFLVFLILIFISLANINLLFKFISKVRKLDLKTAVFEEKLYSKKMQFLNAARTLPGRLLIPTKAE